MLDIVIQKCSIKNCNEKAVDKITHTFTHEVLVFLCKKHTKEAQWNKQRTKEAERS